MWNFSKHFKDLDDLAIYMDHHIVMITLNSQIDESKVPKHPIHYKTLEEFQNATIRSARSDTDPMVSHWKWIMDSRKN